MITGIQWYSPHSAHWSKVHVTTKDWLDSNPDHEVTECGRRPRRTHRQVITVDKTSRVPVCNKCRKVVIARESA